MSERGAWRNWRNWGKRRQQDVPVAQPEQSLSMGSTPRVETTAMVELHPSSLVRDVANYVVRKLPEHGVPERSYPVRDLARAIALTEGVSAAHEFARHAIAELFMDPEDSFRVWSGLYKLGDETALPLARRDVGLGSENTTFTERIGVVQTGGLHSAQRLVELVEDGDRETTAFARRMIQNMPDFERFSVDKVKLFGKLYITGDEESRDLAIESARAAAEYTAEMLTPAYLGHEHALFAMASHAVKNGKPEDALLIAEAFVEDYTRARLQAELFAAGDQEALVAARAYMLTTGDFYEEKDLEATLALAGDEFSESRFRARLEREEVHISDLVTLHQLGDRTAAQRVEAHVRANPRWFGINYPYLYEVGLPDVAKKLVEERYAADPSPENAMDLVETGTLDLDLAKRAIDGWFFGGNRARRVGEFVLNLAKNAEKLRKEQAESEEVVAKDVFDAADRAAGFGGVEPSLNERGKGRLDNPPSSKSTRKAK